MKAKDLQNKDEKEVEEIDLDHIHISDTDQNLLSMTRLPWSLWGLSIISIFCASFLLANLMGAKIFNTYNDRLWWQFFVIVLLYVFGLMLFLFGKVEVVKFDKSEGSFNQSKWILCYRWKGFRCELSDVADITLQREGLKNDYEDSIHFKVLVTFRHCPALRILETKSKTRALEKVREIRTFLGLQGEFLVRDISRT